MTNRRAFLCTLSLGANAAFSQGRPQAGPLTFTPDWNSLRRHQPPAWFLNAKLGIFIHWGLYSVPAWAPPTGELGKVDFSKWFANNPYAEWYLNSIRLKDSQTYAHHVKTYGDNFDYYNFADTFNKETPKWQPANWAKLFKKAGAKYAVLTTKHHDGFTLWPSRVPNPNRPGLTSKRDLVGDLSDAIRAEGLRMGLYYSGGLDWSFNPTPIATMDQVGGTVIHTPEYARYADAHWRELIERYQPSILWNDIGYPKQGQLPQIFSDYYNKFPDGLINNRFTQDHFDFTTPEYAVHDRVANKKWEACRGLGFSFGYNQIEGPEHVMEPEKLITLFVDIVSNNGNLLLNIGPRPDGSISDIQVDRLSKLGDWLAVNGEAIYGTIPAANPIGETASGKKVHFTRKGETLYAFLYEKPSGPLTIENLFLDPAGKVRILGGPTIGTVQKGSALTLLLPRASASTITLKIENGWQLTR
jgi:alpha-L-fucosidase